MLICYICANIHLEHNFICFTAKIQSLHATIFQHLLRLYICSSSSLSNGSRDGKETAFPHHHHSGSFNFFSCSKQVKGAISVAT